MNGPTFRTTLSNDSLSVVMGLNNGEEQLGALNDKYTARTCTIYEEHNPAIQARVVGLLLSAVAAATA